MTAGRPTKMTPTTLKKLEEAFALGASDLEACFYGGISHQTLYNYQEKHPEFIERKQLLKERPILAARQSVIRQMEEDGNLALKFLERRSPDFRPKSEVSIPGLDDTRDKIKEFLDDTDDGLYDERPEHDPPALASGDQEVS